MINLPGWFCSAAIFGLAFSGGIAASELSARAASLADGAWTVEESCGENSSAKDAEAKHPFKWDDALHDASGGMTGTKPLVKAATGVVTDVTYQGSVKGAESRVSGTGRRSNLPKAWSLSYAGTLGVDGRAVLTGTMLFDAKPIRSCTLTFLTTGDDMVAAAVASGDKEDMQKILYAMRGDDWAACQTQAARGVASPVLQTFLTAFEGVNFILMLLD